MPFLRGGKGEKGLEKKNEKRRSSDWEDEGNSAKEWNEERIRGREAYNGGDDRRKLGYEYEEDGDVEKVGSEEFGRGRYLESRE